MSQDPLDHLRSAWQDLPTPPPARDLGDEPADVQQLVHGLQTAWQQLPIPQPRLAELLRRHRRRPRRYLFAAAVLLCCGIGATLALRFFATPKLPAIPASRHSSELAEVEVLQATEDRIELRSGGVRMVLVQARTIPVQQPTK